MKNDARKISVCLVAFIALSVTSIPVYAEDKASARDSAFISVKRPTLYVPLSYPQKSNAPKQQPNAVKTDIVSGTSSVSVSGIPVSQSSSPTLYVEYFIDDQAVYNSRESKVLLFELETANYADGEHTLTANLWDQNGPSAIGIKKIIIKNEK